ncbi:expressed unknown protein [Seminavis robusta]|uniref:Uncharacterized protein n=1 Tax=Seminavis robusta TaxID=568900 RepID=A0A9N8DUN4_9STRA|nr:expressed unknown protein [Seminavis robusta]|eukprot:Sro289_g109010.1 n/a (281) ;mRNA; r:14477-15319
MVDFNCLLAALFIFLGNTLLVIYYAIEKNREHWDQYAYSQLNADFLLTDWEWRRQNRQLEVAGKMITAASWVILTAPVMHLCVVQSMGGDRKLGLHVACVCFALGGAIIEVTAQLMHMGAFNAADWVSVEFTLENWHTQGDKVGWQALEVSWRNAASMTLWVDSVEYLALSFMFLCIFWSVNTMGNLPNSIGMAMGGFAFFIGVLSMADFVAYVVRFKFWETASLIGRIISVMNRVIFVPLFFVCLSCTLPAATRAHLQDEQSKRSGVSMPATGDERHID